MGKKNITHIGIFAALYFILTVVISPLSFGVVQIRFGEMFNHLINYNKRYILALIIGCAISNAFSPLGLIDEFWGLLGTLITTLSIYFINKHVHKMRNKYIVSTLVPPLCMFTVAFELTLVYKLPFWITYATTALGELISCLIGLVLITQLSKRIDLKK